MVMEKIQVLLKTCASACCSFCFGYKGFLVISAEVVAAQACDQRVIYDTAAAHIVAYLLLFQSLMYLVKKPCVK